MITHLPESGSINCLAWVLLVGTVSQSRFSLTSFSILLAGCLMHLKISMGSSFRLM